MDAVVSASSPIGPAGTAVELSERVELALGPIATEMLVAGQGVGAYLETLIEKRMYVDALKMTAYALPIRRAIWWGCLCVCQAGRTDQWTHWEDEAVKAAVRWVHEPSEERRAAAEEPGDRGPVESAATLLARSVAYVGVRLPKGKYSKPQDFPAKGVFSAVWIAAAMKTAIEEIAIDDSYQQFLALGLEISRGRKLWPNAKPEDQ